MSKKYIDADALLFELGNESVIQDAAYGRGRESVKQAIRNFPAADVVEVVRCKDCKRYKKDRPFYYREDNTFHFFHYCSEIGGYSDENDYCSLGENKKEK